MKKPARPPGKCPEMVKFLDDYLDGLLPADLARRFEKHLEDCPGCTAFLNTYDAARRVAKVALDPGAMPKALRERVLSILAEEAKKRRG